VRVVCCYRPLEELDMTGLQRERCTMNRASVSVIGARQVMDVVMLMLMLTRERERDRDNEAYDKKSNKIQSIHPACQCRCAQRGRCLCKCLSRAAMRLAIIGGRLLLLVVETWRSGGSVLVGIREQVGMRGAVFD
jgi:hypothetical protein